MASFNKVILVGNLTRDPEVKHLPSGDALTKFGLAVSRKWKDKVETLYVDCTAFGKLGETMGKHLHKGSSVLIDGRLTLEQWESQGQKRSKHSITVENFTFMDPPAQQSSQRQSSQDPWDDVPF